MSAAHQQRRAACPTPHGVRPRRLTQAAHPSGGARRGAGSNLPGRLRAVKTAFQQENKTQIVARLMVEELRFYGLRDAADTATCLQSYDTTCFPKGSDWTFTRFFAPVAVAAGYKLADDAQVLWNAFEDLHNKSSLPGELEIPMESFARAVEITLKSCWDRDTLSLRPEPALWASAVKACGYVQARIAIRKELIPTNARAPATA